MDLSGFFIGRFLFVFFVVFGVFLFLDVRLFTSLLLCRFFDDLLTHSLDFLCFHLQSIAFEGGEFLTE